MLPIKAVKFFLLNCLKQPVRIDERPSSVNEVDSFPPRGSLDVRQGFTFLPKKMKFAEFFFRQGEAAKRLTIFDVLQWKKQGKGKPVRRSGRPSSVNKVDSFPPWGSLDVRQGFTFLPKKMKFAEFFSDKGKPWNKARI